MIFCFIFNSPTFSDWDSDPTHTTYKILELLQADFTSKKTMAFLAEFPCFGTWNSVILLQWWKKHFPRPCFLWWLKEGRVKISSFLISSWESAQKFGEATTWITWDIAQLVSLGGARHKLMGLTSKHVEILNHFNHLRYQNLNQWINYDKQTIIKRGGTNHLLDPPIKQHLPSQKMCVFSCFHLSFSIDPRDHPCYGPSQQDRRQSPNRPPSASGFSSMTNQFNKGKKTWGRRRLSALLWSKERIGPFY